MPFGPAQGSTGIAGFGNAQGGMGGFAPSQGAGGVSAPSLTYASPQSWTYGVAITPVSPSVTGSVNVTNGYAVTSGSLPTGVTLNADTGVISGTPTAWVASGSFAITATGPGGAGVSNTVSFTMAMDYTVFSASEWLDWSSLATLFQDSARTTPVASDGDPIGAASDKSGASRHVIQATSSKRFTWKAAIQNGLGVGRSDGSDDFLQYGGGAVGAQPIRLFFVANVRTSGALRVFLDGGPGNDQIYLSDWFTGANKVEMFGGSTFVNYAEVTGAFHLYEFFFSGASSAALLDGASVATGNPGSNGFASGLTIGTASPGNFAAAIDAGELVIFAGAAATALTAGNLTAFRAALKAKWATP